MQKSQPHAHHNSADQNTEYSNYVNAHSGSLTDGSPGILKVDLGQRKCQSDGRDNDNPDYKPPIGGSDLFFALRAIRPLQIGHRDALPFAFNRDFQHTRAGALILIKN